MPEQIKEPQTRHAQNRHEDRETQIFHLFCNTSLLFMAVVTDAFSELFTTFSKEIITTLSTSLSPTEDDTKNLEDLQEKFPHRFREELLAMKQDLTRQLMEKKPQLKPLLADKRFDVGIAIVERTPFHLPKLTQDLSDPHLLGYLALLKANDPRCTTMFQELLEWMNTIPQTEKSQ